MSTSPGLRERKKARTRATIQREALRLFQRDGYAATSVEAIAEAAEVSPSTFFRYFPTKEDVVLSDFVDEATIELFVQAPVELDFFDAMSHAVREGFGGLPPEDFALESVRNNLIRTEPELRRGMIAEMLRPMQMLAEAIARRTGREVDDDIRMFAGAAVGALLLIAPDPLAEQPVVDDARGLIEDIAGRMQRLRRLLVLPEPQPE
jgi:AcrR family transcriptional regulator